MSRAVSIAIGLILLGAALWLWESRARRELAPPAPAPPPAVAPPLPQPPTRPVPPPHGRNLWDGATPGSWVQIETKSTTGDVVDTRQEKFTLVSLVGPLATLTREPKGAKDPFNQVSGAAIESQDKWTESAPREEKLLIDGKEVPAQVRDYTHAGENKFGKFSNRARVWKSPDVILPYREIRGTGPELALLPHLLQLEVEFKNEDRQSRHFLAIKVTDMDETLEIGGRKIACIVEEGRLEELRKGVATQMTLKRWISDAVPGRTVQTESEGTSNGKATRKTQRVVDFEIKPAK